MTRAALNVLADKSAGFAVMIEGGAVDWAGHANQLDRLVAEQTDFNNAVQAVVDYPDNNLPGATFFSGSHTDALVPLFAKRARSEAFNFGAEGKDPKLKAIYDLDESWNGKYIDKTCV